MFLSNDEVRDLTGYIMLSAQRRWLTTNNIPFMVGGDRKVKILRQVIEGRLAGGVREKPSREPQLRLT